MKFFKKAHVDTGHEESSGDSAPVPPVAEGLITSCDISRHMLSYLEKLEHVSRECRLSLQEEATVLQTLTRRGSNRGVAVAMENRLAYVCAAMGASSAVARGIQMVRTRVFESEHPFGAMHCLLRVAFPGAARLRLSFDESTELRRPTDFVRFYRDVDGDDRALCAALSRQSGDNVVWGEERYTGTVFKGNFAGARPNPFKDPRPDLVIPASSFILFAHASAPTEVDWGWKLYVTAEGVQPLPDDDDAAASTQHAFVCTPLNLPGARLVIEPKAAEGSPDAPVGAQAVGVDEHKEAEEGVPDAAAVAVEAAVHDAGAAEDAVAGAVADADAAIVLGMASSMQPSPAVDVPVESSVCGASESRAIAVDMRAPRQGDAGDTLRFLTHILPSVLTTYRPDLLPWDRTVKYKRPELAATSDLSVLQLLDAFFADNLLGEIKALGVFFLYELSRGDIGLRLLPDGSVTVVLAAVHTHMYRK